MNVSLSNWNRHLLITLEYGLENYSICLLSVSYALRSVGSMSHPFHWDSKLCPTGQSLSRPHMKGPFAETEIHARIWAFSLDHTFGPNGAHLIALTRIWVPDPQFTLAPPIGLIGPAVWAQSEISFQWFIWYLKFGFWVR